MKLNLGKRCCPSSSSHISSSPFSHHCTYSSSHLPVSPSMSHASSSSEAVPSSIQALPSRPPAALTLGFSPRGSHRSEFPLQGSTSPGNESSSPSPASSRTSPVYPRQPYHIIDLCTARLSAVVKAFHCTFILCGFPSMYASHLTRFRLGGAVNDKWRSFIQSLLYQWGFMAAFCVFSLMYVTIFYHTSSNLTDT